MPEAALVAQRDADRHYSVSPPRLTHSRARHTQEYRCFPVPGAKVETQSDPAPNDQCLSGKVDHFDHVARSRDTLTLPAHITRSNRPHLTRSHRPLAPHAYLVRSHHTLASPAHDARSRRLLTSLSPLAYRHTTLPAENTQACIHMHIVATPNDYCPSEHPTPTRIFSITRHFDNHFDRHAVQLHIFSTAMFHILSCGAPLLPTDGLRTLHLTTASVHRLDCAQCI